jgi:small subunit ribosomal protein S6
VIPKPGQEFEELANGLRAYELMVVLSPDIADDAVSGSLDRLQQSVVAQGGEVASVDHWGRRRLAYPIKRHLEGNYVVSQIRLDPERVSDLDGGLRIAEDVIRHLIVRTESEA